MSIDVNTQQSLELHRSSLFRQVQSAGLFSDSKTFVDAIPKIAVTDILRQFVQQQPEDKDALRAFVERYFELPSSNELVASHSVQSIELHIEQLWQLLKKPQDLTQSGSLLPLPAPYVIPGGRFREIYYWDSYFTALGLIGSEHHHLVADMLQNFSSLQQRFGIIPNGNRSYYLTRSQPPVLGLIAELLLPYQQNDSHFLSSAIIAMEAEYQFWMRGKEQLNDECVAHLRLVKMPDGSILNRYWDESDLPRAESYIEDISLAAGIAKDKRAAFYRHVRAACESGWDFSSRWFADKDDIHSIRTTDIVPVDLNCLLYKLTELLAQFHQLAANRNASHFYAEVAKQRKAAIIKYCWHWHKGFFYDHIWPQRQSSDVASVAAVLPLFVGIADEGMAAKVANKLQAQFLQSGGLVTTLNATSEQWDAPNGWAPLHWFAYKGLSDSGHVELAKEIAQRWLNTVSDFYRHSGKLMEKYDVCQPQTTAGGGEYQVQEGFGWTNGVTKALLHSLRSGSPS